MIEGFDQIGVTPIRFDRSVLKSLQQVSQEVLEQEADKDADFAEILKSQQQLLTTYRSWKSLAYLPRDFDTAEGQ